MTLTNTINTIAIGSFDGFHVAHQALIDRVEGVVVIERGGGYLTPGFKRSWYTNKPLFFYAFDKIQSWSTLQFVTQLQQDFPQLTRIVVGYDFGFGQGREGDAEHLKELFGGEVVIIDEVTVDGISVHSRTIREYLRSGNVTEASRLLGRRFVIDGEVITGQGIGAQDLVPTLNLAVCGYQLPAEGVYATRTLIDGTWQKSVSFIGHRVTTDGSFAIETHVIDQEIVRAGSEVSIEFVAWIRPNQRFDTLDTLKDQITQDIVATRRVLA